MQDPFFERVKRLLIGKPRSLQDKSIFQHLSLIAFFAWVGLGSDGLSSSCYGPAEAFAALGSHFYLGIFVAIASALTVFVISASYSQIIELFPQGGGGYLVASRLLSPTLGMISGCALLVDYVLTITVSIASGSDAIFSFLPLNLIAYKNIFSVAILLLLIIMNLRGVKESVIPLIPIFLVFIVTHVFAIIYAVATHLMVIPQVVSATRADIALTSSQIGLLGMFFLIMRAYSMGAGTYTGIEAVSNGLSILKEPRVKTGKRTMTYMSFSLAFMVFGLMVAYLLFRIEPVAGKTLNAALLEKVAGSWNSGSAAFILTTLVSEAAILFVAAQTGFLGGPRVLANMAVDGWAPKRFSILSDRLVTSNGTLIMGLSAIVLIVLAKGSVQFMIVLYSINVFLTFCLSQLGMVRYVWKARAQVSGWIKKILINGFGLVLTSFILISVSVIKFNEGGWITLLVTGAIIAISASVKMHYNSIEKNIHELDRKVLGIEPLFPDFIPTNAEDAPFDPKAKTAVFFVKDFNGIGVQTISAVLHSFKGVFKNILFVQFGLINAGTFSHMHDVEDKIKHEVDQYVLLMKRHGYHSEGFCLTGIDTVDEISKMVPMLLKSFPNAVFFGGQLVFQKETFISKLMHNYTLFAIQRRLFEKGIPFYVVPVKF